MKRRVLLSTIGSRGDVQPLVALGLELLVLSHEVRMCVPPDFRDWLEGLGLHVTPIGPELRSTGTASPARPTPEQRQRLIEGTVATQFETLAVAAQGCDMIVGATALQVAAPSIAERNGIPYAFVGYCPTVLPSPNHPPPVLAMLGQPAPPRSDDYTQLWEQDARRWNETWRPLVNSQRAALGLEPVDDVRSHILTDRPWLAADPILAPWPDAAERVLQTGAWIRRDERPLSADVRAFLDGGEPPVFLGFGSVRAPEHLVRMVIEAARKLGRRTIVSRGWAELSVIDDGPDCLAIGEVNHQALFPRVGAVVHHGGAGTTTAAARAGAPQVVIPQHYDHYYWAGRVRDLGIGIEHASGAPTTESLLDALERALQTDIGAHARAIASSVRGDGAQLAARACVEALE